MDADEIAVFVLVALGGLILLGWGARNARRSWDGETPDGEDSDEDDENGVDPLR